MEVKDLYQTARALGVCSRFTGRETIAELCALLATPQGLEFCAQKQWPTVGVFRQFDRQELAQHGICVDAGVIKLHNAQSVILVGDTQAELTYDDPAEMRHQVAVLGGAAVQIVASNYAVVAVHDLGGAITTETKEHAIIL